MKCEQIKPLLMGFLDGELAEVEKTEVEIHLQQCSECRMELAAFQKLEEVTCNMKFIEPSQQAWKGYWENIYNRLERRIAWILTSVGAVILLGYGGYKILEEIFLDPNLPLIVKIGVAALGLGFITLSVSVIRERLVLRKFDKYEEVT